MSTDDQVLDEEDWEEEVEAQPPEKCPACAGNRFGIYIMGMPMTDGDFFERLDRDEIRLLGCVFSDDDPFWFCRDCDADILEEGWLAPDEEVARELERTFSQALRCLRVSTPWGSGVAPLPPQGRGDRLRL